MAWRFFLSLLAWNLGLGSVAIANDPIPELARRPEWVRLLHFKHHVLSGWKSTLDGEGFFLSARGQRDPENELRATLAALERGGGTYGKKQQSIHCAFPLRRDFLERALGRKFPGGPCPDMDDFLAKLDADSVSLAFATAYPGNPASMFGHSFLKVSSARRQGGAELLDWSINYAAMVPGDENPFAFTYFGLSGGYAGQFSLVPYYAKIEEYGNQEGRDIWEYELDLSAEQRRRLLLAIWEIETNSYFNYYFFDENCSYQLLTLLEVARPDWDISGYFIHIIPGESVKKVARVPGALKSVRMRASLERSLRGTVAALGEGARAEFGRARAGEGLAGLSGDSLRAYLLYLQAEKKRKGDGWTTASEARLRETLLARAAAGGGNGNFPVGGESTRPDYSHGAYQVALGMVGEARDRVGAELSLRMAYHDLLDADPGYLAHSEFLFPNFRFRFVRGSFSLEEAQFVSIVSLSPWSLVRKPLSWRVRIGYRRLWEDCGSCRGLEAEAGGGFALAPIPERWTVWGFGGGEAVWAERLPESVRARPFVELGTVATVWGEGKVLAEARVLRSFGRGAFWQGDFTLGLSHPFGRDWTARAEGRASVREARADMRYDWRLLAARYF